MTKICTKCKEEKSVEEFYVRTDSKSGYTSHCKKCKRAHDNAMAYHKSPSRKKKAIETAKFKYKHNFEFRNYVLQKRKEYCERHRARVLWQQAKVRAKKFNVEFNIDIDDIIIPEYCPLLHVKLEHGTNKVKANSPSIDRIDNSKGYIKGNVAVICYRANTMKNNASFLELETFCRNMLLYISNDIVRTSVNEKSEELQDKEPVG